MIRRAHRWLLVVLMLLAAVAVWPAQGQFVRLTNAASKHGFYFDMNRLFSYNLYEHTRWGAGLRYIYSIDNSPAGRQVWADVYGAYGVNDRGLKYGAALSYKHGGNSQWRIGASWVDDIEQAASRTLESYTLTNLTANSVYMARRFSHIRRVALSAEGRVAPRLVARVALRLSAEDYLFDGRGMVYPLRDSGNRLSERLFAEPTLLLSYADRWKLSVLCGGTNLPYSHTTNGAGQLVERQVLFVRLLAQYNRAYAVGKIGKLSLFGQLGYASHRAPYSRMFDLGGTWGSGFCFDNAFYTLLPTELTASCYAQLCVRLATVKPLWNFEGYTAPKLFVQVNAMIGELWDTDHYGEATYWDGLTLYAPSKGLVEFSAGVSNLLNVAGITIGAAAAWQVAPRGTLYYRDNPADRLALLSSATLLF